MLLKRLTELKRSTFQHEESILACENLERVNKLYLIKIAALKKQ